jgi:hypothetical protein
VSSQIILVSGCIPKFTGFLYAGVSGRISIFKLAGYQANTVFGASLAKIEYGTQNIPGQTKIIYKRETHSYRNNI